MKRFKNILYVADKSGVSLNAFHHAVNLAERNGARLTLLVARERIPDYMRQFSHGGIAKMQKKDAQKILDRLCSWVSGRMQVQAKIIEGRPFLEIVREVLRNDRDLVIKSAGGDIGAKDRLFGSTDMHLLRKCPCPVWLHKPSDEKPTIKRVMACVDSSDLDKPDQDSSEPLNRMILELGGSLAFTENSEFNVVHVSRIYQDLMPTEDVYSTESSTVLSRIHLLHQNWFDQLLIKARDWIGRDTYDALHPNIHRPTGRALNVIPEFVDKLDIDMLVMGTVARTGIPGLFIGNTAESVLSKVKCSVLAVKPPGYATPVTLDA